MNDSTRYTWHTWAHSRGFPYTAGEESKFVATLEESAGSEDTAPDRQALTLRHLMTAIVTAVRDGATLTDITATAPLLTSQELLTAYTEINHRLVSSRQSWERIVTTGDLEVFAEESASAARILPLQVNRLHEAAGGRSFALVAEELDNRVSEFTRLVQAVEDEMHGETDLRRRDELKEDLQGGETSLRENPLMLPSRVGELTPTRLALLLGEVS